MKQKLIIVIMIAVILAAGMIFVSCSNPDCPLDGDCRVFGKNCYDDLDSDKDKFDCMPGALNFSRCKC